MKLNSWQYDQCVTLALPNLQPRGYVPFIEVTSDEEETVESGAWLLETRQLPVITLHLEGGDCSGELHITDSVSLDLDEETRVCETTRLLDIMRGFWCSKMLQRHIRGDCNQCQSGHTNVFKTLHSIATQTSLPNIPSRNSMIEFITNTSNIKKI